MPNSTDPEVMVSSRYFAIACAVLTWVMLGYAADPGFAAKIGGVGSVILAMSFVARAFHRGVLAGFPLWPVVDDVSVQARHEPDADIWFAQSLAVTAILLLGISILIPPALS
ncbi:MAG: hypothetical protein AAGD23_05850 [Pseudomonadota bacterium]